MSRLGTERIAVAINSSDVRFWLLALLWVIPPGVVPDVLADGPDRVDYNRDIRPILADNCYKCHGPDGNQRQAGFRLGATHR